MTRTRALAESRTIQNSKSFQVAKMHQRGVTRHSKFHCDKSKCSCKSFQFVYSLFCSRITCCYYRQAIGVSYIDQRSQAYSGGLSHHLRRVRCQVWSVLIWHLSDLTHLNFWRYHSKHLNSEDRVF
jgi:hypothetical protein